MLFNIVFYHNRYELLYIQDIRSMQILFTKKILFFPTVLVHLINFQIDFLYLAFNSIYYYYSSLNQVVFIQSHLIKLISIEAYLSFKTKDLKSLKFLILLLLSLFLMQYHSFQPMNLTIIAPLLYQLQLVSHFFYMIVFHYFLLCELPLVFDIVIIMVFELVKFKSVAIFVWTVVIKFIKLQESYFIVVLAFLNLVVLQKLYLILEELIQQLYYL